MHKESYQLMMYFKDKYLSDKHGASILDVGARNLKNRKHSLTYRPIFERNYKYVGMDIEPGNNVDIVGFENVKGVYDIVISGQTMEHVKQPWEWLKSLVPYFSHYIVIIAPHTWKEHKNPKHNCPFDTYRYFPDGMRDLFEYAGIEIAEIMTSRVDTMGVGVKNGTAITTKTTETFMPRPITRREIRHAPVKKTAGHWTICEVLREIYRSAKARNDVDTVTQARIATVMAKRMNDKLREYKSDYDTGWWKRK